MWPGATGFLPNKNFKQSGNASLGQIATAEDYPFIFSFLVFTPSEAYMPLLSSAANGKGSARVQHQTPRSLRTSDISVTKRCGSQRQRLQRCEPWFQSNFN